MIAIYDIVIVACDSTETARGLLHDDQQYYLPKASHSDYTTLEYMNY